VHHADWVMVHALETGPDAGSELTTRFVLVPTSEIAIDDVWFTSGMRATGSDTIRIEGVFVPEHRTLPARSVLDGVVAVEGDGLANVPLVSVLSLVGHNPGFETLVALLATGQSGDFRGVPPGGIAWFEIDGAVEPGAGRLEAFWSP